MAKSDGYQPGPTVIREPPTGGTGVISPSFHVSVTIGHPEAHGLESLTVTGIPSGTKDVTLNMRDIPEWISVEDRLPEAGVRVAVTHGWTVEVCALFPHMQDKKLRWYDDEGCLATGATHWMPLPDPPEVMF